MGERPIVVFADGAALGNPGPGGWGSIVATPDDQVTELGGADSDTTNNRMEMTAVIEALRHLSGTAGDLAVYSDSAYVVNGITKWIHAWRKRGWKTVGGTDVLNRDLWEELFRLVGERAQAGRITWHQVAGHAGIPGNERADEIASSSAGKKRLELYQGPLDSYPTELFPLPNETSPAERSSKSRSGGKRKAAYSYLSVVDGIPMRHTTWPDCESRVKGKSGARFKKAGSSADESEILRSWGFSTADL